MAEKSKRKNDEAIPRRYWWIFGILACLLLYPFYLPFLGQWWLHPISYILPLVAFMTVMVWCLWRYQIVDNSKRKNDEPIPRRYWIIFGTLAIVLLIGLRFPVKILYWWELNPFLYRLIAVGCLVSMFQFIRRYRWQHILVCVMLLCTVLAGWNGYTANIWWLLRDSRAECYTEPYFFVTITKCRVGGSFGADYISIGYIPIGIEVDTWTHL
jgi:hypothetical protein